MSAVDVAAVRKLQQDLGGEADVMRDLLDTFFGEVPRVLAAMRSGLEAGRTRDIHRASHSLKSTAGTFGATRLSQLCRDLEADTQRALPPDAAARVKDIESEWALVRAELEKLRP